MDHAGHHEFQEKDYLNLFRKMVYANQSEMDQVLVNSMTTVLSKNQEALFAEYQLSINTLIKNWKLQ
jgi:hypothetical protein